MSTPFLEMLNERQREILMEALVAYSNRCKTNATRKMSGYGTVKEEVKREQWMDKHEEVEAIISIVNTESF